MPQAEDILASVGAVMAGLHVVYKSGRHGSEYVNKDRLNVHPGGLDEISWIVAQGVKEDFRGEIEVVAGPAMGAVSLASRVAGHLFHAMGMPISGFRGVMSVYAERLERVVWVNKGGAVGFTAKEEAWAGHQDKFGITLNPGDSLVVKSSGFGFNRGQVEFISGKRVLVVEDILTTGGSAKLVVEAVRKAGGEVVGVAAICNRGKVTAEMVGVDQLWSAVTVDMVTYDPAECPMCSQGVPITTEVGHGKEFLAAKEAEPSRYHRYQ